ncbi:Winged helix-like DNA-binding domain superfamily [Sesbania bispinosa]|nr:Winged helix-like DNA-binding domain superfamily [Sesbania bispinosa]
MAPPNGESESKLGHVEEEDGMTFALNMVTSVVFPLAVRSAVELGIFDILAKASEGVKVKLSAADIALQIGSQSPTMIDRLLRLLATHSMLHCSLSHQSDEEDPQRLYSLAPYSNYFVTDADHHVSLGPLLDLNLDNIPFQSCRHRSHWSFAVDGAYYPPYARRITYTFIVVGAFVHPPCNTLCMYLLRPVHCYIELPLIVLCVLSSKEGPTRSNIPDPTHGSSGRVGTETKGAILEGGIPFHRVHGKHIYEYTGSDPRFNEVFNKAMINSTTIAIKRILEVYEGFEHINRLVDVAGGLGINLKLITSKYPHIQGVNFDLPHVIEHAPTYAGVTHVGGDMFESVPNGDAIFMKWILHNWNDEDCLKLLKNCHKAIPDDGKVIVVDSVLSVLPENTTVAKVASQADLIMMTQFSGGKERIQNEFMKLALGSGFSGIRFACRVSVFWVMEFFK